MIDETKPASGAVRPSAHSARPLASSSDHPERIDSYRIVEVIGEGGFGVVYLAEQTEPVRRRVALKVLKLGMDTKEIIARFEAERQALAMMDHPDICKVFGAGATETGRPYFVMELVRGIRITEYCDKHNLAPRQRLELFVSVCQAVQHAHHKGIIHRDIKPSNILVTLSDGQPMIKIIDFGVAKAVEQRLTDKTLFTMHGQLIGTPTYMSPEQAEMSVLDIDTRSDVYALGVLLYELLTGTTPFSVKRLRALSQGEIQRVIREEEPHRPSTRLSALRSGPGARDSADEHDIFDGTAGGAETTSIQYIAKHRRTDPLSLVKSLKGDLDWVIMKAMDKDRTRRYQTANALASDVRRHMDHEPVAAGPPSTWYRCRKFASRHKALFGAAACVAVALVVGFSFAVYGFVRASVERDQKEIARTAAVASMEKAEAARFESEAVTKFLIDMLRAVDPMVQGRDVKVRTLLDQSASKIGEEFRDNPVLESRLREAIGVTYQGLGLYDQAEPHLLLSLDQRRHELGPRNPYVLQAMSNLGSLYTSQGRYDEAEPLLSETLALRREVLGNADAATLESMQETAVALQQQGRHEESEALFLEGLEAQRRMAGAEHRTTLSMMNNLAVLYKQLGRYDEAEPLYTEVLETRRRVLGQEHPDTLDSMNNVGRLYASQGRLSEAEPLLTTALALRRRVLGDEHSDTVTSMNNLALQYRSQKRPDLAEPLFLEAIEVGRRALGEEHPRILIAMNNLAGLYSKQKRFDKAEPLTLKTYELRRKSLGEAHPSTLISMSALAQLYYEQKRYAESESLQAQAVQLHKRAMPKGFYGTGITMMRHGRCLMKLQRYADAEPVLLEAHDLLDQALGAENNWTIQSIRRLAALYAAWDKPEKESEWRSRLPPESETD